MALSKAILLVLSVLIASLLFTPTPTTATRALSNLRAPASSLWSSRALRSTSGLKRSKPKVSRKPASKPTAASKRSKVGESAAGGAAAAAGSSAVAEILKRYKAAPTKGNAEAMSCALVPRKKVEVASNGGSVEKAAGAAGESAAVKRGSARAPRKAAAKKARRRASRLVRRECKVFIGFHGTQSLNAAVYETKGVSLQPLTSGADAELCEGLYITDNKDMAIAFSNNAAVNVNRIKPGSNATPKVCKIFVATPVWEAIRKVYVPDSMLRNRGKPDRDALFEGIGNTPIAFSNLDLTKFFVQWIMYWGRIWSRGRRCMVNLASRMPHFGFWVWVWSSVAYTAADGVRQMCVPGVHQRFLQVVCTDNTDVGSGYSVNYHAERSNWGIFNSP
ncbi:hypothetical protein HDU67_001835 [Dinochytrium kinnereticum]|nr:hypothetical protein HDU67_001835 [Dinochytrium kinnereticum]